MSTSQLLLDRARQYTSQVRYARVVPVPVQRYEQTAQMGGCGCPAPSAMASRVARQNACLPAQSIARSSLQRSWVYGVQLRSTQVARPAAQACSSCSQERLTHEVLQSRTFAPGLRVSPPYPYRRRGHCRAPMQPIGCLARTVSPNHARSFLISPSTLRRRRCSEKGKDRQRRWLQASELVIVEPSQASLGSNAMSIGEGVCSPP